MNDFYINEEFAAPSDKGPTSCWNCKRYSSKMWTAAKYSLGKNPRYRCQNCAFGTDAQAFTTGYDEPYKNELLKDNRLHFLAAGNIFKCPFKLCARLDLSFKEFYSKSCCSDLIETSSLDYDESKIVDHEFMQKISQLHKKSWVLVNNSQSKYDDARKKLVEAEKELKDIKKKFQNIEDKMVQFCSRTVKSITQGKPVEEDSRLFCQICREKYNDDDRVQCVLLCRHSACENCLNTLPAKNCPSCRTAFTDDQIIKLCY